MVMLDPKSSGDIRGELMLEPDLEDVGEHEGVICGEVGGERHNDGAELIGVRRSKCSEERLLCRLGRLSLSKPSGAEALRSHIEELPLIALFPRVPNDLPPVEGAIGKQLLSGTWRRLPLFEAGE